MILIGRTWVVSLDENLNGFRSIREALEAAEDGDRIVIYPGIYEGSFILKKNIQIIGLGNSSDIVIVSSNSSASILSIARNASLYNVTIRKDSPDGMQGAVLIANGELDITNCKITSLSLGGIIVSVVNSQVRVVGSCVSNCKQYGILVRDKAKAHIENNQLTHNETANLRISESAVAKVSENHIYGGKEFGIHLYGAGQCDIVNNDISENFHGVFLEKSTANLSQNKFGANTKQIQLTSKSKIVLFNNHNEFQNEPSIQSNSEDIIERVIVDPIQ